MKYLKRPALTLGLTLLIYGLFRATGWIAPISTQAMLSCMALGAGLGLLGGPMTDGLPGSKRQGNKP